MTDEQCLRAALVRALEQPAPPPPGISQMAAGFRRRVAVERLAGTGVVILLLVFAVHVARRVLAASDG